MNNESTVEVVIEDGRIPVLTPLISLLRSRKFLVVVSALIAEILIYVDPSFASLQGEVAGVLALLATFLVGSIAYEDGAAIAADARQVDSDINALVIEAVQEALREFNSQQS